MTAVAAPIRRNHRRHRGGRFAFLRLYALAACLAVLAAGFSPSAAHAEPLPLSSRPVLLDPGDPGRDRIGRLSWRGGLEISSSSSGFGGLSGLLVSEDGSRLLAVSDTGRWLTASLSYDADGQLSGIGDGRMARLRDPDGRDLKKRYWRDAESLAQLDDGAILVSFEHAHRIWRYHAPDAPDGPLSGPAAAWPAPAGLGQAPRNGGLEAMVALNDGRLLALSEKQPGGAGKAGYLWQDEAWHPVSYQPGADFSPTAASRLPASDDLLVMERAFQPLLGARVRLVRLAAGDIRPGAVLRGEELALWGASLTVDNFEALATRRGPSGETLVYLLSDDNFNFFQRTLLLMFALEEEETKGALSAP